MATVPGGIFDASNTSVEVSTQITSFLQDLGLSDTSVTAVTTTVGSTPVIIEPASDSALLGTNSIANLLSSSQSVDLTVEDGATSVTGVVTVEGGSAKKVAVTTFSGDTVVGGTGTATLTNADGESAGTVTAANGVTMTTAITSTAAENVTQVGQQAVLDTVSNHGASVDSSTLEYYNIAASRIVPVNSNQDVNFGTFSFGGDVDGRAATEVNVVGVEETSNTINAALIDIFNLDDGSTVNVENISKVLLAGAGNLVVSDDTNTFVNADATNQMIAGGEGNDTLIGGGGTDTLVGGSGDDTFGFDAIGNVTINDFGAGDKFVFENSTLNSLDDLADILISAEDVDGNAVYTFETGETDTTITVVGVSVADITAGMIEFDL